MMNGFTRSLLKKDVTWTVPVHPAKRSLGKWILRGSRNATVSRWEQSPSSTREASTCQAGFQRAAGVPPLFRILHELILAGLYRDGSEPATSHRGPTGWLVLCVSRALSTMSADQHAGSFVG
jgi:hypothetical protein